MAVKSKKFKNDPRIKRRLRIRKKISGTAEKPRISVFKSVLHTYAQAISDRNGRTLANASTLDKEVLDELGALDAEKFGIKSKSRSLKSVAAATAVGLVLGRRLKTVNVTSAVFDRSGFIFHGRVRGVAEGIRRSGVRV